MSGMSKIVSDVSTYVNKNVGQYVPTVNKSRIFIITLGVIAIALIVLFSYIFNILRLQENACSKLEILYPNPTNQSYFNSNSSIKASALTIFDTSNSILINYHVKSAYNCCCGDGYKNNFVALCALQKCIANGCRFLDFEIYSYNNDPIIASSTADNNYIKESYNALLLSEVLNTITEYAFDGIKTICSNDPLILNFRVMSTNAIMLEKMGDLFEEYLDKGINANFSLLKVYKDAAVLNIKMRELYRKIIIICDFKPNANIIVNPKLTNYINLRGSGSYCHTYRHKDIVTKNNTTQLRGETISKYVIVLPDIDNSIQNFDSTDSFSNGCQAICMKHQNLDNFLKGYNDVKFGEGERYSWRFK